LFKKKKGGQKNPRERRQMGGGGGTCQAPHKNADGVRYQVQEDEARAPADMAENGYQVADENGKGERPTYPMQK
jgi:hypothetical protein